MGDSFHTKLHQLNYKQKQDVNFLIKNTIDANLSPNMGMTKSLSNLQPDLVRQQRSYLVLNCIIRSINKDFNDRVSLLWNARDEKVKLSLAMSVYRDLMEFWNCLSSLQYAPNQTAAPSSSSSTSQPTSSRAVTYSPSARMFYSLRHQFISSTFPAYKTRIESFLSNTIQKQWTAILSHRYSMYRYEFMELSSIQRCFHTIEDILPCTATAAMLRHVHEDQSISTLCQRYLEEAFLQAYQTVQPIAPDATTTKQLAYYRYLIVVMYSTMLTLWLQQIINNQIYFDESGVYTLYRILLQLQEQLQRLKRRLSLSDNESLWEQKRLWHRLQIILHILNLTIFQYKEGNAHVSKRLAGATTKVQQGNASTGIAPILTNIPSSSTLAPPMTPAILSPSQIIPLNAPSNSNITSTTAAPNIINTASVFPDTRISMDATANRLVDSVAQQMVGYTRDQILEIMSEEEQMVWRTLVIHPHGARQETANPVIRVMSKALAVPWMKVLRKKNHGTIFAQLELNYQNDL
jgi:hypothetical protein